MHKIIIKAIEYTNDVNPNALISTGIVMAVLYNSHFDVITVWSTCRVSKLWLI